MANVFGAVAMRRAARILRSANATRLLARAVLARGERFRDRLGDSLTQFQLLALLLKDWASGRYRQVPWATLVALAGTLVYFLMPLDAIPDAIVAIGLMDDLVLLRKTMKWARRDIDNYQQWRRLQGEGDNGGSPSSR
ncbi:hypothetical protein A11A3_10556 [Alcanivorax hongdengensis A-11-3]|uniref:DUF1232 domain-containing protein n=1 Tax=Alcanivorax hongdengensis A-11-3 TaxID=1177179 RepID=L0WBE3_9GAMM|nr:DUF1232 domain-containing protein [Alcanivorax hongdengensis]EKF74093.1 hypothetical protein A11A3_10556 [Alcanivorax hongdengensis A-11-3]